MERLLLESTVDLIPLFSVEKTRLNCDLVQSQSRIKDIVSNIEMLKPIFVFPSLDLRNKSNCPEGGEKELLHEAFSQKLSIPIEYDSESIVDAPKTLLHNLSFTFLKLLESRMNNSILAVKNRATLPGIERNAIVDILSSSTNKLVSIASIVTRFKVLSATDNSAKSMRPAAIIHLVDNKFQIPIIFEFCMDLLLLSTVQITAQISIKGSVLCSIGDDMETSYEQSKIAIELDNLSLLKSLMSEAHRMCTSLIATASSFAFSKLENRVSCPSNMTQTMSNQKDNEKNKNEMPFLPNDNDVSGAAQQDVIDMPPPPPRSKPRK
jgi:hypothetical protein